MKVQNYQNIKYEFAFTAMPGKHLIKYLSKNEFKADKFKIMRFENLFSDAYSNITDHNTVIDIDKKNNLIFSHLVFPNVKYCSKDSRSKEKMSARSILNECSKTIATGESVLFQQIVKKEVES
ncbi:MAG: hypothetical protein K2F57_04555 [Candidatus Gastranaerophilales bacterium]|nr:hypothetical protein [Candidatus Gastranaerophilales bacterium]